MRKLDRLFAQAQKSDLFNHLIIFILIAMELKHKCCEKCKYAYNSEMTPLVQCHILNWKAQTSGSACTSVENWYGCSYWQERPARYPKLKFNEPFQTYLTFSFQ